jgi:hypothetical protein
VCVVGESVEVSGLCAVLEVSVEVGTSSDELCASLVLEEGSLLVASGVEWVASVVVSVLEAHVVASVVVVESQLDVDEVVVGETVRSVLSQLDEVVAASEVVVESQLEEDVAASVVVVESQLEDVAASVVVVESQLDDDEVVVGEELTSVVSQLEVEDVVGETVKSVVSQLEDDEVVAGEEAVSVLSQLVEKVDVVESQVVLADAVSVTVLVSMG